MARSRFADYTRGDGNFGSLKRMEGAAVAKTENEEPDFDEFDLPDDLTAELPDLPEDTAFPSDEPVAETVAEPGDVEAAQEPEAEEIEQAQRPTKRDRTLSRLPAWMPESREALAAVGLSVLVLLLALVGLLHFSTAFYLIAVGAVVYALWQYRDTNSVFTIILGCALIAMLTAIYCLWREWGSYRFDTKAREARPQVGMSRPVDGILTADIGMKMRA